MLRMVNPELPCRKFRCLLGNGAPAGGSREVKREWRSIYLQDFTMRLLDRANKQAFWLSNQRSILKLSITPPAREIGGMLTKMEIIELDLNNGRVKSGEVWLNGKNKKQDFEPFEVSGRVRDAKLGHFLSAIDQMIECSRAKIEDHDRENTRGSEQAKGIMQSWAILDELKLRIGLNLGLGDSLTQIASVLIEK